MIAKKLLLLALGLSGLGLILGKWGNGWDNYSDVAGLFLMITAAILYSEWF
jgi:hypothetical protein